MTNFAGYAIVNLQVGFMRLKNHESPRRMGKRNDKGASTPKKARQKKKQLKLLKRKLSGDEI